MNKRIEAGRLQWPRTAQEVAGLSYEDFHQLLDGYAILQKSTIRQVNYTEVL